MSRIEKLSVMGILIIAILFFRGMGADDYYVAYIDEPVQRNISSGKTIVVEGNYDIELGVLAEYRLEGVIKGKKRYRDYPSQISEYDLALAWGSLNSAEIDEHISYSQRGRWYYYRYSPDVPVTQGYISKNSANTHIIHSTDEVLKAIRKLRANDHILLEGYLVQANFKDGPWTSSLTRDDTGDGACEIMYVKSVELIGR